MNNEVTEPLEMIEEDDTEPVTPEMIAEAFRQNEVGYDNNVEVSFLKEGQLRLASELMKYRSRCDILERDLKHTKELLENANAILLVLKRIRSGNSSLVSVLDTMLNNYTIS